MPNSDQQNNQQGLDPSFAANYLLCATSDDSITWTKCDQAITRPAASLGAMYNGDEMFVYHHRGRQLYVSVSKDGMSWEEKKLVISGISNTIEPFDPEPVILDNGKYRLYFYEHPASDPGAGIKLTGNFTIGSAISSDGINFVVEPGSRNVYTQIMDPNVIKIGNVWRMYNSQLEKMLSFVSYDNGLTFQFEKILNISGFSTGIVPVSGGYRMYYRTPARNGTPEIRSAFSSDGANWQEEGK